MNGLNLRRYALSVCAAAVSFAGCGGSQSLIGRSAGQPAVAPAQVPTRRPTEAEFESWRSMMLRIPKPENACMVATYPETQWQAIACVKTPNIPLVPATRRPPKPDYSAAVKPGAVSFAYGFFQRITGVKSEYVLTSGHRTYNLYSLQLNTQPFTTTTCKKLKSPHPKCQGWEQFVYTTSYPFGVFIQYWLLNFGKLSTQCPEGWHYYFPPETNEVDCYVNSITTQAPLIVIKQLIYLTLLGGAPYSYFGSKDGAGLSDVFSGKLYLVIGDNWFPDLGKRWQDSEFNVFGNSGGAQAIFNTGSTIVVRTLVSSGTKMPPTCDLETQTGETNNLILTGTKGWGGSDYPSIIFTESNASHRTKRSCEAEGS